MWRAQIYSKLALYMGRGLVVLTEGIGNDKINTNVYQQNSASNRLWINQNTIREDVRPSLGDVHLIRIDAKLRTRTQANPIL